MNLQFVFAGIVLCVACCSAQDAALNRTEPSEYENFAFIFEHVTNTVLVRQKTSCYIWTLTDDELTKVHTDDGLRMIEMRVIQEIDDALYTVLPANVLSVNIVRICSSSGHLHVQYFLVH